MRKIITYDNSQENRYHRELHRELGVKTYFCNPYSPWEKGSVENAIGLTRRVCPKKTNYGLISEEEIASMEYKLNTRPGKRFNFLISIRICCYCCIESLNAVCPSCNSLICNDLQMF